MKNKLIRPTYAEINLKNLKYNFKIIKSIVGKSTKIIAVIKANAYGHDSIHVGKCLEKIGADIFGVATIEEGVSLRTAGIKKPILILGSVYPYTSFEVVDEYKLIPTISSLFIARKFAAYCKRKNKKLSCHIKIDTGMNRIGISSGRAVECIRKIAKMKFLEIAGVYTHLANADSPDEKYTLDQLEIFNKIKFELRDLNIPCFHIANSAGIFRFKKSHLDAVRPGIALYGLYRDNSEMSKKLRPVMSIKSKIIFLKRVPKGKGISYGHTYKTYRDSLIATVPIGYADGYARGLSNFAQAIVNGKKVPLVGRICMDMVMFDVTGVDVRIGDEIILMGGENRQKITANDLADILDTISYEVICNISARVPRIFV